MTEGKQERTRNQLAQQFRGLWLNNGDPFPLMADVVLKREAELVKALEAIMRDLARAALTAAGKL